MAPLLNFLLLLGGALALSTKVKVVYSEDYDMRNGSLYSVSCSDSNNGIITKYGWKTFEQIPDFPYIGGSNLIEGYDSEHCGECYAVSWQGHRTYITAIDSTEHGLVMSKHAMNSLTAQQAEFLGEVEADVEIVHRHWCSLPA